MKLRFTTKCFIFSITFFLTFRILQIIFLTEPLTAFLKPEFLWLNILGTVLCLIPTLYTAAEDFYAFRCPQKVGRTGLFGTIVCLVSGTLILTPAIAFLSADQSSGKPVADLFEILFPLLGFIGCVIIAASEKFGFKLAKPTFLLLLASLLYEFIMAYSFYTGKSLRVRTVYEILAIVLSVLFFLNLSKANCGVKTTLNFRLVYPLGSLAATFCVLASVPEIIGTYCFKEKLTGATTPTLYILGVGIMITYLTIATNTLSNTKRINRN